MTLIDALMAYENQLLTVLFQEQVFILTERQSFVGAPEKFNTIYVEDSGFVSNPGTFSER